VRTKNVARAHNTSKKLSLSEKWPRNLHRSDTICRNKTAYRNIGLQNLLKIIAAARSFWDPSKNVSDARVNKQRGSENIKMSICGCCKVAHEQIHFSICGPDQFLSCSQSNL
jgi:hypothetical protein